MVYAFTHFLEQYGVIAVMVLVASEYLGLPLPTELAYVAAHQSVKAGGISYPEVFALIMIAHIVGSTFSYEVGLRAAALASGAKDFSALQERLMRWYKKHGPVIILGAQLIGHVRPWASYIAGFSKVKRSTFFMYNVIGSALLTAIMLAIADKLVYFWHAYPWFRIVILAVFAVVIIVFIINLMRRVSTRKTKLKH